MTPSPQCLAYGLDVHEVGIMQKTLDLAVKTARESGASRIHQLRMRVGAMSGVVPDALKFAFEVMQKETMADGARLDLETVPVICWCQACQLEFPSEDLLYECPQCHQLSGDLRCGCELELASLEIS